MMALKAAAEITLLTAMTALFVFNGLAMMLAPKWWLRLPSWVAAHGTLKGANGDDSWVSFKIRFLGFIMFSFVFFCVWGATEGFSSVPSFNL
jgi:hypothetical protein